MNKIMKKTTASLISFFYLILTDFVYAQTPPAPIRSYNDEPSGDYSSKIFIAIIVALIAVIIFLIKNKKDKDKDSTNSEKEDKKSSLY
jgi:preprotein translocase subunit SecG